MIIDCHTHAWDYWPYEPAVPVLQVNLCHLLNEQIS